MAYAVCKDCGVQSDQNGLINHKGDCPIRQKILEVYGEPMPLMTPLQYREEVARLRADLKVLHAGIQSLIDSCQDCGGDGERSMVPGGMSKCMGCLPLRDLIYKTSEGRHDYRP